MSTTSDWGTREVGLVEVRKDENETKVRLGWYDISMKDFLFVVEHLLTDTDLEPNDPRLQFVECVKSMKKIQGRYVGGKRLKALVPPIVLSKPTKGR